MRGAAVEVVADGEAALMGKALPLAPADLAAVRPDLFPTAKAVVRYGEERNNPPKALEPIRKEVESPESDVIPCPLGRFVGARDGMDSGTSTRGGSAWAALPV